jgi:prepilin-type N-terminal cleavage/methylation domain-containing protein
VIRYIVTSLDRKHASTLQRSYDSTAESAFTLIELLVVLTIIAILAGLVLTTVGYARKKSARARAETEIAAMAAACENYNADNGVYPVNNTLNAQTSVDPTAYPAASLDLYKQLSGDSNANRNPTGKIYMTFKPNMLFPADQSQNVLYIQDPFGNSYGYSTINNPLANPTPTPGYNPTFDLWSTAGGTTNADTQKWIKNW